MPVRPVRHRGIGPSTHSGGECALYRILSVTGQWIAFCLQSRISWVLVVRSGGFLCIVARRIVDRLVLREQDPDHAGVLVGNGDRRPVVSAPEGDIGDPGVPPSELLASRREILHRPDDGTSSMDQKRPEVGVSPLGDPQEHVLPAARVLSRHQADVGRKVSAVLEAEGIAHNGDEDGGGQDSHAGNAHQPLAHGVLFGESRDPTVIGLQFLTKPGEFGRHGVERLLQEGRDPGVVRVVQKPGQLVFHFGGGDFQDDPVLGQDPPDVVDRGRPELDQKLPGPMKALQVLGLFRLDGNGRDRRPECIFRRMIATYSAS